MDNFNVKKGTELLISPLIYLRDNEIWGNQSELFIPERFDNLSKEQKELFIPFIVGQFSCPGKLFAELEASIVVSKLFYDYELELLDHKIIPSSSGTFRLTNTLPVKIIPKFSIL